MRREKYSKVDEYRALKEVQDYNFYVLIFAVPTFALGLYKLKEDTLLGVFLTIMSALVCYSTLKKLIVIRRRIKWLFADD